MGFDIDEMTDIQNWKEKQGISLRVATEDDLDEIFNLIQVVGKEMESKNSELFACSKTVDIYLQMLRTGVCAVAVKGDKIIASLLTHPEDNSDGIFDLIGISDMSDAIDFATSQVLEEYRGNKLEQQLINFVLTELYKTKRYRYAVCTVCPDNKASLRSVENCGFEIRAKADLYGGKTRYVLMQELTDNKEDKSNDQRRND